jgi:hypothetical protein
MLAARPLVTPFARVRAALSGHDGLQQIGVVLATVGLYEVARMLMEPDWPRAFEHARQIVSLEQLARLAWEDELQRAFLQHAPTLVEALNVFYFVGHFLLTGLFFLWLYHRSREGYRVFRDGFLVATAISVLIHWQFPTAPPRLTGIGVQDTLLALSGIDIGSPSSSAFSNPVAAVPSLHAAWAVGVGVGIVLFARSRWLRALGAVYPPLVVLTIVVTGNHFIFDAVAGIAVLGAGFALAGRLSGRARRDATRQAPCYT